MIMYCDLLSISDSELVLFIIYITEQYHYYLLNLLSWLNTLNSNTVECSQETYPGLDY